MSNQQAIQSGSMDDRPNGSPDDGHPPWYWSDDWWAILIGGLLLAIGLVAVIWLIVLPGISRTPAVDRWIEFVEQQRVDPSAMFYTEVEGMPDTQQRIDRLRTQHAGSFWTVVPPVRLAEP